MSRVQIKKYLFKPVLVGTMGVGKSSCQDVCMWNLCGSREVSKIDSDTRNSTVKRLAAMKTFPTTIEVTKSFNCRSKKDSVINILCMLINHKYKLVF